MTPDKDHNKKLLILCFTEFFSCFSFFGMLSVLILFFVYTIHLPQKSSYELLGSFVALSFIASQIAGFIGGRYLPFRFICLMGLIAYSIGYFLLMHYHNMLFIYAGLTFVACGVGLFEPNIRSLLGIHYKNFSNHQRSSGFIVLHTFNIAGQLLGPILLTYLRVLHPDYMFLAAGAFVSFGMIFFAINYSAIAKLESSYENENTKQCVWKGIFGILFLVSISFFILQRQDVRYILEFMFLGIVIFFIIALSKVEHDLRIRTYSIFLILFGASIAEILFRQCFGIIDLFTKVYVNRMMMGIEVHTGMFESVEPFFIFMTFFWIIKFRKYLEVRGHSPSAGSSISFGLLMLSICFGFLAAGTYFSGNSKISVIWLLSSYFFMGVGELFIIPIATASVAAWSPENWRGMMMGVLFLTTGFSSYVSAEIGKLISPHTGSPTLETYRHLFSILTFFAAVSAIFLYIVWKFWERRYKTALNDTRL